MLTHDRAYCQDKKCPVFYRTLLIELDRQGWSECQRKERTVYEKPGPHEMLPDEKQADKRKSLTR